MGLSSTVNREVFTGDGSSVVFAFPYYFFAPSDLQVYLYNIASSSIQAQILNTNYTIGGTPTAQGVYPGGGSVIMNSSFTSAFQLIITRSPSPINNFTLSQNGPINALAITQQFDYLTALVQRLQDEVSRCVQIPDGLGSQNAQTFNPILPPNVNITALAGSPLLLNASSTGWTFGFAVVGSSGVQSFFGILPIANGGTGAADNATALINLVGGVGSAGQYLRSTGAALVLSAISASDVPTLNQNTTGIATSALNIIGSSVIGFQNGGTSQNTRQAALNALHGSSAVGTYARQAGSSIVMSAIVVSDLPNIPATLINSGVLPLVNGGTGAGTQASAISNLLPSQAGQAGNFLSTNGSSVTWTSGGAAFVGCRYVLANTATVNHMAGSSFSGSNFVWDQRDYDTSAFMKINSDGGVGAANGLFTIPANGYYQFIVQTTFDGSANNSNSWHQLKRVDGAMVAKYFGTDPAATTTGGTHYVTGGVITVAGSTGHQFYIDNNGVSGTASLNGTNTTTLESTWVSVSKVG